MLLSMVRKIHFNGIENESRKEDTPPLPLQRLIWAHIPLPKAARRGGYAGCGFAIIAS